MTYYSFQPDLVKNQPVLTKALLGCEDNYDPKMIQDVIINILPGFPLSVQTKILLRLILVTDRGGFTHYDLAFSTPCELPEKVEKYQDAITVNLQNCSSSDDYDLWELETYYYKEHNLLIVSFNAG